MTDGEGQSASGDGFQRAYGHLPLGVAHVGADGRFLDFNDALCRITGRSRAALLALTFQDITHPDDLHADLALLDDVAGRRRERYTLEKRYLRDDGTAVWVNLTVGAVWRSDARLGYYVAMVEDIDARKAAERALQSRETSLRQALAELQRLQGQMAEREHQLQTLADNVPDVLTRFDPQLRHVFVNAAVERATGRPRQDFLGKTNRALGMPAALCDEWEASLRRVIDQGEAVLVSFDFDTPGGLRHFEAHFVPERAPDGRVVSAVGLTRDVTEQRALHEALREADRQKDTFLATLAHELRNPLAPLRAGLEVLRRQGGTPRAASVRDMMERQLGHLVRLVDDLLEVSRISSGKVRLNTEAVTVQTVLTHAIETIRPALKASAHRLQLDMPAAPLWLEADLIRLSQVFGNLLGNACKYTPPGGVILVSAATEGGQAVVRVADNGAGIPAAMLPRVFDLFAQVDSTLSRAQGGLGIGLSLARNFVQLHGGSIEVASDGPGLGSTFVVRLPLAEAGAAAASTALPAAAAPAAVPPRRTVLIVDDNADAAESLAMCLQLEGHAVTTVNDGWQALEQAALLQPSAVLLDIGMPGLDGYELARRLRASGHCAGALLVAVTGWGTEDDKARGRAAGFDAHMTKPLDLGVLLALLNADA